jgi:hypothetical protein
MMNCDPNELIKAAKCYRCIPRPVLRATMISLLCRWANGGVTPPEPCRIAWAPDTEIANWVAGGIAANGDLAAFRLIDPATVTDLTFNMTNITELTCVRSLTNLDSLVVDSNPLLTDIDASDCPALNFLEVNINDNLVNLDVTGCGALTWLDITGDPNLTAVDLTGCFSLDTFNAFASGLLTLDFTPCLVIDTLTIQFVPLNTITCGGTESYIQIQNTNVAAINVSGFPNLDALLAYSNAMLTALDVTNCAVLLTLQCYDSPIGELDCTGCVNLDTILAYNCSLTGANAVDITDCALLTYLEIYVNDLSTSGLDLSGCVSLTFLDCNSALLPALDISFCPLLVTCIVSGNSMGAVTVNNPSMTDLILDNQAVGIGNLDLSTCGSITNLRAQSAGITAIDIGPSVNYVQVDLSNNAIALAATTDDVLSKLLLNCCANMGFCDLSGGTNAAPTLPCGNPLSDCWALNNVCFWVVLTN